MYGEGSWGAAHTRSEGGGVKSGGRGGVRSGGGVRGCVWQIKDILGRDHGVLLTPGQRGGGVKSGGRGGVRSGGGGKGGGKYKIY